MNGHCVQSFSLRFCGCNYSCEVSNCAILQRNCAGRRSVEVDCENLCAGRQGSGFKYYFSSRICSADSAAREYYGLNQKRSGRDGLGRFCSSYGLGG